MKTQATLDSYLVSVYNVLWQRYALRKNAQAHECIPLFSHSLALPENIIAQTLD